MSSSRKLDPQKKKELNLDKASDEVALRFTKLMLEGPLSLDLPRRGILTAAALQETLKAEVGQEGGFEIQVLQCAGSVEVANAFGKLLEAGELNIGSIMRYTQILVSLDSEPAEMIFVSQPAEELFQSAPDQEPESAPNIQERRPESTVQEKALNGSEIEQEVRSRKKIHYALTEYNQESLEQIEKNLDELGVKPETFEYLERILTEKPRRIGTTKNAINVYRAAVESGEISREDAAEELNSKPSKLFHGPGGARKVIEEMKTKGPSQKIYKKATSPQILPSLNPSQRIETLCARLSEFGIDANVVDYISKALTKNESKIGTAINAFHVFEEALKEDSRLKNAILTQINDGPSTLLYGPNFSRNKLEMIRERLAAEEPQVEPITVPDEKDKKEGIDELLRRVSEFGVAKEKVDYLKDFFSRHPRNVTTAINAFNVFYEASRGNAKLKAALVDLLNNAPSMLSAGPNRAKQRLEKIMANLDVESPQNVSVTDPQMKVPKEEIRALLRRIEKLGVSEQSIERLKNAMLKEPVRRCTAKNAFDIFENGVTKGMLSAEFVVQTLDRAPSILFQGPGKVRKVVGNKIKQTIDSRKSSTEETAFFAQLEKFGISNRAIKKVQEILVNEPQRLGTCQNSLELFKLAAAEDPAFLRPLIMALNGYPSYIYRGPQSAEEVLDSIKSGKRNIPDVISKDAIQRKSAFLSQSDTQEAAKKCGIEDVPDVDTCSRDELAEFTVALLAKLKTEIVIDRIDEPIEDYVLRIMKPKAVGGRGHSPERLAERLVMLIRHFGKKGARAKLVEDRNIFLQISSKEFYEYVSTGSTKKQLAQTNESDTKGLKSDETIAPLIERLEKFSFEPEFFSMLIDYYRAYQGMGVPGMIRRIDLLEEKFGFAATKELIERRHKMVIYTKNTFETALAREME
jgi:hypothetical protein